MYANLSSIQAGGNLASFVPQNGRIILIDCSNNLTSYTGNQSSRLYNNYLIGDGVTTCANLTLNSFDEEDVLKQYVITVRADTEGTDNYAIRTDTTFSEIIALNEDGYNIICNVNNGQYIAYLNSISSNTIKFVFEDPNASTTYTIVIDNDDSVTLILNKISNSIQSITEYTQSIDVSVNDSYDTAISKLRKIIIENEYISAAALNDLNDRKLDSSLVPTKLSDFINDTNYVIDASIQNLNKVPYVIETAATNVTIEPYKMYDFGTVSITMNIAFDTTKEVNGYTKEYMIRFTAETGCTVVLPNTILYANRNIPNYTAGHIYEITIVNNCAVVAEFY